MAHYHIKTTCSRIKIDPPIIINNPLNLEWEFNRVIIQICDLTGLTVARDRRSLGEAMLSDGSIIFWNQCEEDHSVEEPKISLLPESIIY